MRFAFPFPVFLITLSPLSPARAAPATGEILHGRIVDCASLEASSSGKGIAGARLVLYDAGGKKLAGKTTSKQGTYRFAGLAPGTYTLSIDRKEYLPFPLLRVIALGSGDTLSRDFTLDKIPMQGGQPARGLGKKKSRDYYPRLAEGMLAAMRLPEFHRESGENRVNLSRFFDAEDTTEAYRALWTALLWADVESQQRPIEADVYLAHALDSALGAANLPAPAALKPYLKVPADSVESLAAAVRAMMLSPSKKPGPETLAGKQVPRSMLARVIEERMGSKAVPKPKKKAFLAKVRGLVGPEAARRLALLADPPKRPRKAGKPAPAGPPRPDVEGIWKVVLDMAGAKRPNPVALFHVASRRLEQGQAREALAGLERMGALRADYPQAVEAMARCRLSLADTAGAEGLFDSLSRMDSPEWQARGFQGAAKIQWRTGRPEKAEAALWRAMGLDSKSAAAREALLLLAEVSLARDSWSSVEGMLDSLVKARPREADGHFWLGRMALKRQQDGVALGHFQKAAALAPQRADFAAAVAAAYFAREECGSALKTLKPLRSGLSGEGLSIYGRCLLQLGKAGEAAQEFERLQASHPSPQNLAQWARALSASGNPQRAVKVIRASGYADDFEVRKALAAAQIDMGSADLARQSLEPPAAGKENDAELHFLLGMAAFSLREYADAGKQFTSALQYREDYPEAKYRQGLCLLKQGRSGEAHHYFLELADSDKPSWRAKGLLGRGQAFAKEEKPEAAAENLRRSFQASASAEAAAHLALACLRMDRNEEASAWAAKARKLDPDEPLGLMASVDALLAAHRVDEAVALAGQGLDRHPDGCDFMVVAAKAHLRAGHDDLARDLSQRARGRCPEESAPYYFLGTLSARAGTVAEARRHFGEYMRTGGDAKRVPEGYR
ncbi:MAG TPA: tetratricopeptide repeat protein [Fibrobacteria bacterium]|nr:tetratricopeptide repeat protein [Fibrobacteria bacterium]